jgi:hypothetical protein
VSRCRSVAGAPVCKDSAFQASWSVDDGATYSRFIVNLPDEELQSIERICFQIEQAHWYYEDFVRPQASHLPSFSLRKFSEIIFKTNPLLR